MKAQRNEGSEEEDGRTERTEKCEQRDSERRTHRQAHNCHVKSNFFILRLFLSLPACLVCLSVLSSVPRPAHPSMPKVIRFAYFMAVPCLSVCLSVCLCPHVPLVPTTCKKNEQTDRQPGSGHGQSSRATPCVPVSS